MKLDLNCMAELTHKMSGGTLRGDKVHQSTLLKKNPPIPPNSWYSVDSARMEHLVSSSGAVLRPLMASAITVSSSTMFCQRSVPTMVETLTGRYLMLVSDWSVGLNTCLSLVSGSQYMSLIGQWVSIQVSHWSVGHNNYSLLRLWWQQDGAPPHCTNANMAYLDTQFQGRVISRKCRRGRRWPPRSPDLSPLDFFLWGYLKSKVYNPRPSTLDQLEQNIRDQVALLDPAMVNRAILDIRSRAERCIANNGGHVE